MASKDQAIGALIFLVCLVVAIGYVVIVAFPSAIEALLPWTAFEIQFAAVAAVVLIAFLAIMFIGAWIGWTMATTPPPKPIEELEEEIEEAAAEEVGGAEEAPEEKEAEEKPEEAKETAT